MEGADEVLALRQVEADLAADGRVDLGEQRRRQLDERDAAQPGRGQEPSRIAERAAAAGDDRIAALHVTRGQLTNARLVGAQRLGRLAARQQERLDLDRARVRRPLRQTLAMVPPRLGFGGHRRAARADGGQCVGQRSGGMPGADVESPDGRRGRQESRALRCWRGQRVGDAARDLLDPSTAFDRLSRLVEAGTSSEQVADGGRRLAPGDERPHRPAARQPGRDDLRGGRQAEGAPAPVEPPAVPRIDDRAATSRDDAGRPRRRIGRPQPFDGRSFPRPEAGLALGLEDARDARPGLRLDDLIEVDERGSGRARQPTTDGALAAPRWADQHHVHGVLSRPRRSRTRPRQRQLRRRRRSWRRPAPASARDSARGCRELRAASRPRTSRARSGSGSGAPSPRR